MSFLQVFALVVVGLFAASCVMYLAAQRLVRAVVETVDLALVDVTADADWDDWCDEAEQLANTPLYDALARMNPRAVDAIAAAYAADFDPDLCDWTQRKDRA